MTTQAAPRITVAGLELVGEKEPNWTTLGRRGTENLIVTFAQAAGWFALLTVIDSTLPLWVRGAALVLFFLGMQGVFTMAHEFCHRNAHKDSRLSYLIGWVTSTIFGTSPTFLRVQHWGHHRRNRTEPEIAEYYHEHESKARKVSQYYFANLGGMWVATMLFPIVSIPFPYATAKWFTIDQKENTFSTAFNDFDEKTWTWMRVEGAVFLAVWGAILLYGPWQWSTLALAYGAFAVTWSWLQWVYHMRTPFHVIEGAYNLRAPWLVRVLFLNFNYNLTHHRHPAIPWQELPRSTDVRETQPLWYRSALVALPPEPFPADPSVLDKRYF